MPKEDDIPADLKMICPLCDGSGKKTRYSFFTADAPIPKERQINTIGCNVCHGSGWLLKHTDHLIAEIVRLRNTIKGLTEVHEGKKRPLSEIEKELLIRNELPHNCDECGSEGTMVLSGTCHPGAPSYPVVTGQVLSMECSECRLVIGRFLVTSYINESVDPNKAVTS